MAERGALERLPYRELVKLAQSAGITDVKLLMPANHQALITAVLTVQQKQADREKREKRFAVVRTLAVPGAAVVTAAVASTKDGKEALMAAWPSVALFWMLLLAFFGWSPLNEGYNWQRWELRLPRAN